jgi:hypothetical protein
MTRANRVSRLRKPAIERSDHRYSTCDTQGGTQTMSIGPLPSTM